MNSEKVKEIKEALEQNNAYIPFINEHYNWDEISCADILTLINELESDNERLKTQLAQANAGIVNCSGCKFVEINAVREFAERLKEKMNVREYMGVKYKQGVFSENDIDETLMEYEKCGAEEKE